MAACFLIGCPGCQGFLLEVLARFLALDVLLNGFKHDPVRRAATLAGEMLNASFQHIINLEGRCHIDRKSVVQGKSVSLRLDLGCPLSITKNNKQTTPHQSAY